MNWRQHGVGRRFEGASLDTVDPTYFAAVHDYAAAYDTHLKTGRGLLLSGPPGVGKTYAAVALMKKIRESLDSRFDFYVVTAPDMFEMMEDKHARDEDPEKSWFRVFSSVQALVINDLGKEDRSREWLSEAVAVKLGRVLRKRHEAQLPVFITTNVALLSPKNNKMAQTFTNTYGESIWSLIYDMTVDRVQVNAPDLRKQETPKTPENPASPAKE